MSIGHTLRLLATAAPLALVLGGCGVSEDGGSPLDGPPVDPGAFGAEPSSPPVAPSNVGYPPLHPSSGILPTVEQPPEDLKIADEPVVLSVEPAEGMAQGGDVVTIRGDNFHPAATVTFGDFEAAEVFYINEQFVNATTPEANPGLATVRVANPDGGEGELVDAFLFFDELEVHSVDPAVGTPLGGEPVTVTGRGFEPGVAVLIGDRLALDVEVQSGGQLTATTPPGAPGAADVRVLLVGELVAQLEGGFLYVTAPQPESVWPPHGATIGGSEIEVTGRYFKAPMTATLGGKPAVVQSVSDDGTRATLITPGGPVGPADLHLEHAFGAGALPDAFTYLAPGLAGLHAWSITPAEGSASGGYTAIIVVQGLDPDVAAVVKFGSAIASVADSGLYPDTLFVEVPPGAVGYTPVAIGQAGEWVTLPQGFVYTEPLALSGLSPEVGGPGGGAVVTLYGEGFESVPPDELTVFVGPWQVGALQVLTDTQMAIETPPCSPGLLDVTLIANERTAVLRDAFDCVPADTQLFAVDPPLASQSGGALVKLIGAGFSPGATVTFGDQPGTAVEWHDHTVLWARVPRGEPGAVDVGVSSDGTSATALVEGLLYYDPANKKAAVTGGLIDRTINVSIFDSSNGSRVEDATAILGADPDTPYQCVTDDRGQCTISHHGLHGAQQITAAKPNYSAYTIAGFRGESVTMYIRPQSPPSVTGPPGPGTTININELVGTVRGTVSGMGKYVNPPLPDCSIVGTPDGYQCLPCNELSPCGGGMQCVTLAATGSWCVKPCASDADCANGYACAQMAGAPVCVPHGGDISARCATSRRNFFGTNPDPGPNSIVDPHDPTFEITSRMGEVTVYCLAGYTQPQTQQFIPTIMGMRQTVVVGYESIVENIDIQLDIPLTRTLRMRLFDRPEHESGITWPSYRLAVDIGAEGWIPFVEEPTYSEGELRFFAGYPESLAPFGKDAAYTFYTSVQAQASPPPGSYVLNYRMDSVDGDPVHTREAATGTWDEVESGMRGDLFGLWGTGPTNIWGVGPHGRMVHRGPLGWSPQPNFTDVDLYAIHGSAADDIIAVGDDGMILHFDGVTWEQQVVAPFIAWPVRAVHGSWAVGDGGILHRAGETWSLHVTLHSKGLRGVVEVADDLVIAVGESGKVLTWDGGSWTSSLVAPTGATLRAVASDGVAIVAVGDGGVLLARRVDDPSAQWSVGPALTRRDLNVVAAGASGEIWVGGTTGTLLRYDTVAEAWTDESANTSAHLDIRALLWLEGAVGPAAYAAGFTTISVGPWMAFPEPVNPAWYQFLTKDSARWAFLPGGPDPAYNSLYLSSADGFTVWSFLAAGDISRIDLPPLLEVDSVGYDPIPEGQKYFNLTRALNPEFTMDGYRFSHLSMWRRTTWSSTYGVFY